MKKLLLTAISIMLLTSILFAQQPEEAINNWAAQQTKSFDAGDVVNYLNGDRSDDDITYFSEHFFNSGRTPEISATYLDNTHIVVVYEHSYNIGYSYYDIGKARIGTINGGDISFGPEFIFSTGEPTLISAVSLDVSHFVIAYRDNDNSYTGTSILGTVSGDNISFGSETVFNSGNTYDISITSMDNSHFAIAYTDGANADLGTSIIGSVTNNTISFSSEVIFNPEVTYNNSMSSLDANHFIIAYMDGGNSYKGTAILGTLSGNSISYSPEFIYNDEMTYQSSTTSLDMTHFVIAYRGSGNSLYSMAIVGTLSGSNISFGSARQIVAKANEDFSITSLDNTHVVFVYRDNDNDYGTATIGTISGNNISFGSNFVFNYGKSDDANGIKLDATHFIAYYMDNNNNGYGATIAGEVGNVTQNGTIWNGPNVTFSKADYADWTLETNQDHITNNIWLTREDSQGIFNIKTENNYNGSSPEDTEWSTGNIEDYASLNFESWYDWEQNLGGPPATVGVDAVVHLITENIYLSIQFTSWTQGGNGGGFSYERSSEGINTCTWDGSWSTNWNTATNWNSNTVPTQNENIVIPSSQNNPTIIPGNIGSCNNLTIDNGVSLTLHSDGTSGTASLITNGTITNNGTINVQRYITDSKWHLISSPLSDATASIFAGDYLQYYNGTWNDITNAATTLTPVQGYSLWDATKSSTYTYTGDLNNGDQSIAISSANDGWNLLGNPYPSPIDWSLLDDTYGAVYYWDSENSNYVSWNNGGGTGAQYVPAMQGFWINTTSDGTFNISNTERTHSGTTTYYKNRILPQNYLELQVDGNNYYDRLCININDEATNDFDFQYDAYKLTSPEEAVPQLYSIVGNDILSIDVRPPAEVIQLGFQCGEDGNYSFNLNKLTDISSVVLEDTKTGIMHNLQNKKYDFEYLPSDDEKRFKLHLQVTGINDSREDTFIVYSDKKTIYLKSDKIIIKGTVKVLDITGRTMYKQSINNSSFTKIPANYKTGVYIVMIENGSDVRSKKVIINQ